MLGKYITFSFFFLIFVIKTKESKLGLLYRNPRSGIVYHVQAVNKTLHSKIKKIDLIKDGYQVGLTIFALVLTLRPGDHAQNRDVSRPEYYTNAYRWLLRHIDLVLLWLGGNVNHAESHRVWRRRFYFMDEFIPTWLQKIIFHIRKDKWEEERKVFKEFKKYAEPEYSKHFRYPDKGYNHYISTSKNSTETYEYIFSKSSET